MHACVHMRTTIDLPGELLAKVKIEAIKRKEKGFSKIIQDAIIYYFKNNIERTNIGLLKGSLTGKEKKNEIQRLTGVKENWRKSY